MRTCIVRVIALYGLHRAASWNRIVESHRVDCIVAWDRIVRIAACGLDCGMHRAALWDRIVPIVSLRGITLRGLPRGVALCELPYGIASCGLPRRIESCRMPCRVALRVLHCEVASHRAD